VSEKDFQRLVVTFAQRKGWRVAHFRTSMNASGHYMTAVAADGKGFPDLCLVRDRIVFAELKHGKNTPTEEQWAWLLGINDAGGEAWVWRLADWDSGKIQEVLK
jgi:hypothetical protein